MIDRIRALFLVPFLTLTLASFMLAACGPSTDTKEKEDADAEQLDASGAEAVDTPDTAAPTPESAEPVHDAVVGSVDTTDADPVENVRTDPVSGVPLGRWHSVDFVQTVEQFSPGTVSWPGNMYLTGLEFPDDGFVSWSHNNGSTSLCPRTFKDGWLTHENGRTRAQYFVKTMDGATYLFFPWLSGDVTVRGQEPQYYVLKKLGEHETPPPQQRNRRAERG